MKQITLDDQQHATVLAALHFYLRAGQGDPSKRDDWTHYHATNCDTVVSMDGKGIARLIDLIQYGSEKALSEFKAKLAETLDAMTDEQVEALLAEVRQEVDEDDPQVCDDCGAPTDDGEGYDGQCSDCAEREVEILSKRGMTNNLKEPVMPGRTFRWGSEGLPPIDSFIITETEPDSPLPPGNYSAWRVLGYLPRRVVGVLDLEESARYSAGIAGGIHLLWEGLAADA